MLQSKEMTNLKTIVTTKNDSGVFESSFKIVDGKNDQSFVTEFPEGTSIMDNIFDKNK